MGGAQPCQHQQGAGHARQSRQHAGHGQRQRRGRVQLIDGSQMFTKMRKSLGSKRKELSPTDIETLVRLYAAFDDAGGAGWSDSSINDSGSSDGGGGGGGGSGR